MTDITILGLGLMGSALASMFQRGGQRICVWNRSIGKASRFVDKGAVAAASVNEAIESSQIVVICVSDYSTTRQLLESDQAQDALNGHIVVQFSTGTPREALESEHWMRDCRAAYLDGAILSSPGDVASQNGRILIGGKEAAWTVVKPVLECLGGSIMYTGENIRAPAILDLAWLTYRLTQYLGVFSGVMLCDEAGIDLDHYSSIVEDSRMRQVLKTIKKDNFQNPSVTVDVYHAVLSNIQKHAIEAGVNLKVLDQLETAMVQASNKGYGDEDIAALIKTFRTTKPH